MIETEAQYRRTRQFVDRLQDILLNARTTSSPEDYALMSRSLLKDLAKAQREIAMYLASAPANNPKAT